MLPNSNKKDDNFDKNLKLMSISAAVLIALFIYTIYRSSATIQGSQYYIGITFLFVLLIAAALLQFYRDKIKKFLSLRGYTPTSKFQQELKKHKAVHKMQNEELKMQDATGDYSIQPTISNITFDEVAGIKGVKEELEEVVDFLNNPKKYQKYGVNLPRGVLLVGPPGVGKTLVARAVAGEANVPFFYQSGASFVHIYVGMGAKRVRELFSRAKAQAPSIIFIDEIDAVGKARSGSRNDEREATLNELLTQMDGFEGDSGVIVIAATNKIEVLDEALLRAGRFDRRVFLQLPSIEDRRKILELYLKGKKFNFDIDKLSLDTAGFSSAALSTLVNEALLNMIKRGAVSLVDDDIEVAKNKVQFGKKEHQILDEKQREILAIYQSAKAYISNIVDNSFEKRALFDEGIASLDRVYYSKSELENSIKKYLAGHIAIEVIKGEAYTLFDEDLKKANQIADDMVNKYEMSVNIDRIKNDLRAELSKNSDIILRLKDIMLKNESITVNDL